GQMQVREVADRGTEAVLGVLGRDAALDGRAARRTEIRNVLAGCNPKLLSHQIASEANLGHRMLDLQARVDLEEVELAILKQELDGARALITDRTREPNRGIANLRAQFLIDGDRGRFLDQLLMTALNRALAFAERDDFAVAVAEDLNLYMARLAQILLNKDASVAECRLGLARGRFERRFERGSFLDHTHPAAASTGRCLHQNWISNFLGERAHRSRIGGLDARNDRHARSHGEAARRDLVAHRAHRRR